MHNIKFVEIDSVTESKEPESLDVYDIEVENNHTFIANNIITHNCRLRNELEENDFSYSLGFAGVETGSHSVMTINWVVAKKNGLAP